MGLSSGSVIVREGLLGLECPHGFGYTMPLPVTALKTDLRAGAMSNAVKELIETLPITILF
ncbi:hypothetical protein RHMOL_Rhmol10G0120800 [Rhododendron molle]|uniref:Uncharacterized protein n=1 Tax=Rhododendron molle TaxID=49168 RepID=A0ACC0M1G9_RHOML|nr:hypothetical protein RHMOL_Rhmol10G0120800 [Rhododendron molle]